MRLTLVDADADVANAIRLAFATRREVTVLHGDLISVAENTVVSPANAYGLMDGGIDAAYAAAIPRVQDLVRDAIACRPEGYLPLGAALLVAVQHARIQYVLATTTTPFVEAVTSDNAYRAMRALLRVAAANPDRVRSVYCPGLCTGIGMVPPDEAARAMASAYEDWLAARAS